MVNSLSQVVREELCVYNDYINKKKLDSDGKLLTLRSCTTGDAR